MSIKNIHTYVYEGTKAVHVTVEITQNKSLPCIEIIGLADTAVKEAKQRIRSCMSVLGVQLPPRKILINLSPSGVKKKGSGLDLALALSVYMLSTSSISLGGVDVESTLFFGEVGLTGDIKEVQGLLGLILGAIEKGWKSFVVPMSNISQLENIPGIDLYGVSDVRDLVVGNIKKHPMKEYSVSTDSIECFSHIYGHEKVKRALSIAIAGGHNILLIGSPGSGKSVLAKGSKDLLGYMDYEESLETTLIHSMAGITQTNNGLVKKRPFFVAHHTVTTKAMVGGGATVSPGLVSQAHNGVLFLDEVFEFGSDVLQSLREPLEDKKVCISRMGGSSEFPSSFVLVATGNPCPCGYYGSEEKSCMCTLGQVKRYQKKIQGPFLDRIDMIVSVYSESTSCVISQKTSTHDWSKIVRRTQEKIVETHDSEIFSGFNEDALTLLIEATDVMGVSTRSMLKVAGVAKTICIFEGHETILPTHVAEALSYKHNSLLVA